MTITEKKKKRNIIFAKYNSRHIDLVVRNSKNKNRELEVKRNNFEDGHINKGNLQQ